MWSREIFVTIVVALTVSVSNVMPYYNDFQQTRAHSPNEADFLKTNINWERKFGDPDFKDAIHFRRLNLPDQRPTESLNENKTNQITVVNLGKPAVRTKTADLTKLPTKSSDRANINQNFNENPYLSHPHDYEQHSGKGEIFIHRPSPIIIKRPPTKVLINHPPLVVKPAPVVFHRPPPVVVRPVVMKSKSRNVKVQPVYVNVEGGKSKKNSVEDKENFDKALYGNRFYPARNGIYKNSH